MVSTRCFMILGPVNLFSYFYSHQRTFVLEVMGRHCGYVLSSAFCALYRYNYEENLNHRSLIICSVY